MIENRGSSPLLDVSISSDPDYIGWCALGPQHPGQPTSTYFRMNLPRLEPGEHHQLMWCEATANKAVIDTPFAITLEFDNPLFRWPRRLRRTFNLDLRPWTGIFHGMNTRFDIHNVAQELARIREVLAKKKPDE